MQQPHNETCVKYVTTSNNLQRIFPNTIWSTSSSLCGFHVQKNMHWNVNGQALMSITHNVSDHDHLHHGWNDYPPFQKLENYIMFKIYLKQPYKILNRWYVLDNYLHTSIHVSTLDVHENPRAYVKCNIDFIKTLLHSSSTCLCTY